MLSLGRKADEKTYRTGLYYRLSKEDGDKVESDSIVNQRAMIRDYVRTRKEFCVVDEYVDDGYSGSNFERPDFKRLYEDLQSGAVNCVIVKDLSRFGRNYIEVGRYLERLFPLMGVRLIAINDNYDSMDETKKDSLIVPIKNLVNDIYSKDLSRKISGTMRMKEKKGEIWYGVPAYGYWRKPDQPFRMETDEETAPYVRLMFQWTLSGMSYAEIAFRLNQLQAITPTMRLAQRGHYKEESARLHTTWAVTSVKTILHNPVYMGDTIYNRSYQCVRDGTAHVGCFKDRVNETPINNLVFRELKKWFQILHSMDTQLKEREQKTWEEIQIIGKKIGSAQAKVKSLQSKKVSLYEEYSDGKITREYFLSAKAELTDQINVWRNTLNELHGKDAALRKSRSKHQPEFQELIQKVNLFENEIILTRTMTDTFLERVVVYDQYHIEIQWKWNVTPSPKNGHKAG